MLERKTAKADGCANFGVVFDVICKKTLFVCETFPAVVCQANSIAGANFLNRKFYDVVPLSC